MITEIQPNPWMVAPFIALLAAIALAPLRFADWWGRHYPKVCFALAALVVAYYLFVLDATPRVLHTASEYFSFIALIGSLFVVSGGIHITIKGEATPRANVIFLAVGALVANVLGTTGASMLLIRPWLRANKYRVTAHHMVFFIFIVSNAGGCLTPVGDPPLFLGYLNGVPFWWVAQHGWHIWLTGVAILLAMFYVVDARNYARAPKPVRQEQTGHEQWRFDGLANLFFLALVLGAVFVNHPPFLREALMIGAGLGSYFTTRQSVHKSNHFNLHPIKEVAILFVGIFATMMPALDWLATNAGGSARPRPAFSILAAAPFPACSTMRRPTSVSSARCSALPGRTMPPRCWRISRQEFSRSVLARFFSARTPTSATDPTSWSRPSPTIKKSTRPRFSATL